MYLKDKFTQKWKCSHYLLRVSESTKHLWSEKTSHTAHIDPRLIKKKKKIFPPVVRSSGTHLGRGARYSEDFVLRKGVSEVFSNQCGTLLSDTWSHCFHLLQLFGRMLQHWFAEQLQKCLVDCETSPDFPLVWGWTVWKCVSRLGFFKNIYTHVTTFQRQILNVNHKELLFVCRLRSHTQNKKTWRVVKD